jgi:hypothetical protein
VFKVLIDTCVWLDLAKDQKSGPLLDVLEMLVKTGNVELLVPRVVVDEFTRNKARVAKEGAQSLSSALRRVREAVWTLDVPGRRAALAKRLTDIDLRLPSLGESAVAAIGKIDALMKSAAIIETSNAVKVRAAERALAARAPFHRSKNSMGDAILIELYADALGAPSSKGTRFAFVTHNKHDFSQHNGDHRKPHPDLAPLFSKIRSLYCITLADLLRRVDASLLTDQMMLDEWESEPRSASAILDAIEEFIDKVWYNRHKLREERIADGRLTLAEQDAPVSPGVIHRGIWAGALKAARRVEKQYGEENLGPWDDFEWGMINGKLSALRWVLGEEWDMLDT